MMKKRIAVIACSRQQFDDFLRDVNRPDRDNFVLVQNMKDVEGREFSNVIRVGSYYDLPGHLELYNFILAGRIR